MPDASSAVSAAGALCMCVTTLQGVPRCVLQLVAVGCMFLAAKQLEVHHPSVDQMVQVAAHSFTQVCVCVLALFWGVCWCCVWVCWRYH